MTDFCSNLYKYEYYVKELNEYANGKWDRLDCEIEWKQTIDTKKAPVSIELTGFCYVENFPATNPKSVDNIEFVRQMWALRVLHIFLIRRLDIIQFNPCVFQLQLAPPIFFFRDGYGQPGGNLEQ